MAVNYNIPLQTQLEYMMQELQGPEARTMEEFGSGKYISPQDYAAAFDKFYERSDGKALGQRRQYALEIFRSIDEGTFENLPDNVKTAFNFFKRQGFTDPQAAGIVGNLQVESNPTIDPNAFNPSENAYGAAQFRGPRLQGLLQYAGKQGENTMDGNAPFGMPLRATMKQDMPQQRGGMMGGIRGLLDYGGQINPQTGLSRFETFAAALDPLIMPSMRGGEAIRARGAQRVAADTKNKTVNYLRRMGYNDYADAVESGAVGSKEIMNALVTQKLGGSGAVRSTKQFINGTVVQSTDTGVVVYNPEGKVVTGEEAQKVINEANEYELSYAQRLAGGKKLGGISVEVAQDAFEKIALVNNSITNIDSALDALDKGAQSGMIYNMIPNVTLASGQLEAAMNSMGLDVISSVTFGALSEGEMRLAMETAVPRNLPPEELRKYLQNKKNAQIKAKAALTKAATYLSNPANSLNTWLQEQASKPTPKIENGEVKVWNPNLNDGLGGFE